LVDEKITGLPAKKRMTNEIPLKERIIFALDVPTQDDAKRWVETLKDHIGFFKIGLQLFLAGGFPIVEWVLNEGAKVFVDLKFFDVPETVKLAVENLAGRGVTFATVHGNDAMLEAAVESAQELQILAVTALTSLDEADLRDLGFQCSVKDLVLSRARRAIEIGCSGVISSGLEVTTLRKELGDAFLIVAPGIRPVKNLDDQKRTVDARQAFEDGADHIVVGRPIRDASDPIAVINQMQGQIQSVFSSS
jgi:orotidine-5'-phosphate decarboxylase